LIYNIAIRFQRISAENKEGGIVEINRKTEVKDEKASEKLEKRYKHLFRGKTHEREGKNRRIREKEKHKRM
jgi:hypothetical protein